MHIIKALYFVLNLNSALLHSAFADQLWKVQSEIGSKDQGVVQRAQIGGAFFLCVVSFPLEMSSEK